MLAVDPGGVHCGVAYFEDGGVGNWSCTDTGELTREGLEDRVALAVIAGEFDVIVVENFTLFGDLALAQTGSDMPTSQVIGAVKVLIRLHNRHAQAHVESGAHGQMLTCEAAGGVCVDPNKMTRPVELVMQPPDIQTPMRAILRARKMKSKARAQKAGDHAFSAELHGWHWILK